MIVDFYSIDHIPMFMEHWTISISFFSPPFAVFISVSICIKENEIHFYDHAIILNAFGCTNIYFNGISLCITLCFDRKNYFKRLFYSKCNHYFVLNTTTIEMVMCAYEQNAISYRLHDLTDERMKTARKDSKKKKTATTIEMAQQCLGLHYTT